MNEDRSVAGEDPRVMDAARDYLAELEAGRRPDRRAYLGRHPEIAAELAECLDGIDLAHGAGLALGRPAPAEPEFPPAPLGDFQILREIGRGGMGVVYEAVQGSLGRRVALKVLPFAAALDEQQLQRFRNEAQAAAGLHHSHIVPVYFVGCERGVHFYAMQLIEGRPLDAVIRERREARSSDDTHRAGATARTGSRSAGGVEVFRTAARLAAQVADALEYAHQAGVVHRDVKPANLLLDGRGSVWVTDFGLAHVNDVNLTRTGEFVGTLRYVSPEQAAGSRVLADHRADVYSLGATLYELLTLEPIFAGTDRRAILRQILEDEPRPPRQIDRAIPVELETIVLKAVAKEPADRYASAADLADDLRRFLEDVPIRARRPSLAEKATKWARRHRSVVASAVAALLLTSIGLAAATAITARAYERERSKAREADEQRAVADEQRRLADQQRLRADQQRARAEENFRQAREAVEQLVRLSEQELAGRPDLEGLRWRLLETALAYYQSFLDQQRDDPSLQADLEGSRARVRAILAELTILIGSYKYAILHQPDVQKELGLSKEQREALGRIGNRWMEAFTKAFQRPPADAERSRLALAKDQKEEVARLLTAAQMRRFRGLAAQFLGPAAFSDPQMWKKLSLTPAQVAKVRAIQNQTGTHGPRFGPPGWGSDDGRSKAALQKILAQLTPEQRARWDELVGEPFTFKPFGPPRPPEKDGRPR
jgi:serine/threonine protein kinase